MQCKFIQHVFEGQQGAGSPPLKAQGRNHKQTSRSPAAKRSVLLTNSQSTCSGSFVPLRSKTGMSYDRHISAPIVG